jgi:hypothetical protein
MGIVGLDIGAFILFRVWVRIQLTSYGKAEKLLIGNIGAVMLNAFCMVVLTQVCLLLRFFIFFFIYLILIQIYKRIAKKLTG